MGEYEYIKDNQKYLQCFFEITERSLQAVFIFDEAGKIVYGNELARTETGYGEELSDIPIYEIFPTILQYEKGKLDWLLSESDESIETSAYRKNKTCYPVKAGIIKKTEDGIGGMIFTANFTERKDGIRRLKSIMADMEESDKQRTELMANITHELRTPVNGMKGMAENLLDTSLTPIQQETVNIIIRCCNTMSKLINDILDMTKLEAGKLMLEQRRFNFKLFLDDIMAFNHVRINEKGLKLIVNVAPNIPTYLIGDELRLGQVINNLISNAIKFTSVGYIALDIVINEITETQIDLFFMVMDTGIGMNKDDLDKLFKSFSQVDGSITRRFGGTGLGLSICKSLVELMGGSIHVESEKNKGSTFSFSVHMLVAEPDTEETIDYPSGRFVYRGKQEDKAFGSFQMLKDTNELFDKTANLKTAREALEKLVLCSELGTWEKAEEFAGIVKNMLHENEGELWKKAFRLELSVRKEDSDKTLELAKQLGDELDELLS